MAVTAQAKVFHALYSIVCSFIPAPVQIFSLRVADIMQSRTLAKQKLDTFSFEEDTGACSSDCVVHIMLCVCYRLVKFRHVCYSGLVNGHADDLSNLILGFRVLA